MLRSLLHWIRFRWAAWSTGADNRICNIQSSRNCDFFTTFRLSISNPRTEGLLPMVQTAWGALQRWFIKKSRKWPVHNIYSTLYNQNYRFSQSCKRWFWKLLSLASQRPKRTHIQGIVLSQRTRRSCIGGNMVWRGKLFGVPLSLKLSNTKVHDYYFL